MKSYTVKRTNVTKKIMKEASSPFRFVSLLFLSLSRSNLLLLLSNKTGRLVHNLDPKLLRTVNNELPAPCRHIVVDHGCVLTAVHQKKLEVTHVGNVETELPISSLVLEATVSPIPDLGLGCRTLELSAHRVVNTMGLSPPSLHVTKKKTG